MITIAEVVESLIKKKPFIEGALYEGLINLSSLARQIRPEIEEKLKKPIKEGAIVMALKRLSPTLDVKMNMKIKKALSHFGDIIVRSNLADFTFKNSDRLIEKQKKLLNIISNSREIFHTISKGVFETTIVISNSLKDALMEIFKEEELLNHSSNLSSISIKLPEENLTTPGLYYFIFKKIAWEGINILEVISTSNEFTIILNDKDIDRAFSILKNIGKE
ncbi:MAG: aspartate kinase [Bacteroidales bacterium]|nr:aspartate kinase [Bacteroidales bacterium]